MKSTQIHVGCSGWYYRHWKGVVYPDELPQKDWFQHYQSSLKTVELNAPFYHWPKPMTVQKWARAAKPDFRYSVKANRLITHLKRFNNTKRIIREFCECADALGEHMGCFLFQLPPSFDYSVARLRSILGQLDPRRRNVVEFRHRSWWRETVFAAFQKAGLIFCSVSAPGLPDEVIKTADAVYLRFHGAQQWYRHDYSDAELEVWAERIRRCRVREIWAYFNNDFQGNAFRNAQAFGRLLSRPGNR